MPGLLTLQVLGPRPRVYEVNKLQVHRTHFEDFMPLQPH